MYHQCVLRVVSCLFFVSITRSYFALFLLYSLEPTIWKFKQPSIIIFLYYRYTYFLEDKLFKNILCSTVTKYRIRPTLLLTIVKYAISHYCHTYQEYFTSEVYNIYQKFIY